ncbi:LCP family protein [Kutzneria viridogrisea]|uniref:LytR family transcription regulator n=2 Tax=Kutzneria TaxID=43356 RepID=W5W0H6_9PSEU|nr:LCP family protein [Kutzneria albida]AHH94663.1 LytR family transcription regulator [Kutzneria albida DSM 43870]MBA8930331.1 LCP family protein required for cell wall assembly [Kutzneria viridogrisea]
MTDRPWNDRGRGSMLPPPRQPRGHRSRPEDWQPARYATARSQRTADRRATGARRAKIALATASVLVLGATWFGWTQLQNFSNGLTTANVIDPGAGSEQPADGSTDILLVGMDSRLDAQGNPLPQDILNQLHAGGSEDGGTNTDTMILIHIPNGGGKAAAISIPRDAYVDIAGGYGPHKINSAFSYGKNDSMKSLRQQGVSGSQLEVQSNQEGAKTAIRTVQDLTGVTIDHYAQVNLVGFYEITQAIGGVDVCLKAPVDDSFSGAHFAAGQQSVAGAAALAFVRQRHGLPQGDLDRIKRQQVFMAGLAKKVLSAGTLTDPAKLSALADSIKKSVVLDQGWNILGFAQQMRTLTGGNLQFSTIPIKNISYQTPNDGDAVQVDQAQVAAFVQGLTNPASNAANASSSPNATITVDVLNGAGSAGLAGRTMDQLTAKGFGQGATGNTPARTSTLVTYGSAAGKDAAQKVADALGGGITVSQEPSLPAGHVEVYLGSDYTGPGAQGFTGSAPLSLNGGMARTEQTTSSDAPITADGVTCVN